MEVPYDLASYTILLAEAFGAILAYGAALIVVSIFRK